jgi:hypothetical protein
MKRHCLAGIMALSIMAFLALPGYSQERFQANLNFELGFPQGAFKNNVDRTAIGGSADFLYRLLRSPFLVGASCAFMNYGCDSREEFFSPDIPEVLVDVTTTNNIFNVYFLFRFQPLTGPVQPYVEALLGLNYLYTETAVYDQEYNDDEEIASTVQLHDTAFSYGAGAGVMISILGFSHHGRRIGSGLYLDLGLRYLKGGRAEYMREGDLVRGNGTLEYYVRESTTDLVKTTIGLTYAF